MNESGKVVLLLGSNIEPREEYMDKALLLLRQELGAVKQLSSVYESEPWGFEAAVPFLNRVAVFKTGKSPLEVLEICLDTEQQLGRERKDTKGYISRTMDVDILYFDDQVVNTKNLVIPHPSLHLRRFTLLPLAEVIPGFIHPVLKKSQKELLNECTDSLNVVLYK